MWRGSRDGLPFVFDGADRLERIEFQITTTAGDVDILATIAGLGDYANVSKYVDEIAVLSDDKPTPVLSLDGLILAKRAANGPKDLPALPEPESMLELRLIEQQSDSIKELYCHPRRWQRCSEKHCARCARAKLVAGQDPGGPA